MRLSSATTVRVGGWVLRLALSAVFIYAGILKMHDPRSFAESIASFRLLPPPLINPAAWTLPVLEILSGVLALGSGPWRRVGAFSLLAMLAIFVLALASATARGLKVDCGCFGAERFDVLTATGNLWPAILRDLVLSIPAWVLYAAALRNEKPR